MKTISATLIGLALYAFYGVAEVNAAGVVKRNSTINLVCAKTLRQSFDISKATENFAFDDAKAKGDFVKMPDGRILIIDRMSGQGDYYIEHPDGTKEPCLLAL